MRYTVALFGESEKGQFQKPYIIHELTQLVEFLGNPPEGSQGISCAVQAILYKREIIYFRVEEEGFSKEDYFNSRRYLLKAPKIHALYLPGVGDGEILDAFQPLCAEKHTILLMSPQDLQDFLTS